ncbi:MAG: M28 family peptidase [Acidobacteriota bacterium]|nr:M28 family peptidase [Acidobacteriota bacterium]
MPRFVSASVFAAAVLSLITPAVYAQTSSSLPPAMQAAERSIDAEKIRAHVRFLADDLLEGRGPGVRGGNLAAAYIATQFALDGLKPGGDNGTYFQQVDFFGMTVKREGTTLSLAPASGAVLPLRFGPDYVVNNPRHTAAETIDAPIVFVGYGVTAPEFGWDDYAGLDVKGKVVLIVVGDPPSDDPKFFGGKALTYYGRWTYKYEQAARKGAVGALIIHRTDLASYPWTVVENSGSGEKTFLANDRNPKLAAAAWIHHDIADALFAAAGLGSTDAEIEAAGRRGFKGRELPVRLKAHIESAVRPYQSPNVVGILPGRSTGKEQALMYTAHYDHLGIDPSKPGDSIYNGAADNATGCGIVLELARAWTSAGTPPPHSIVFASVTAEEQGLLGSEYLGQHPPIPAGQIALDLNYDDVQPFGDPLQVSVSGAERTSFFPTVEATAKRFGMAIVPDAHPEAGHYYRSDHFSMARAGVPAFSIGEGTLFAGHDAAWGLAKEDDYTAHRYHTPNDNYTPDMDFTSNAKLARFGMELGWQALTAPSSVSWKAGDEFEAARKSSVGQ